MKTARKLAHVEEVFVDFGEDHEFQFIYKW